MVDAYRTCQAECASTQTAVDAARERLTTAWTSDRAAAAFRSAIDEWVTGFQKVRHGLDMLDAGMQRYARVIAATEDDSSSQAA